MKQQAISFCPKCKSTNVVHDAGVVYAADAMLCKDCNFRDVVFPTKEKMKQRSKR